MDSTNSNEKYLSIIFRKKMYGLYFNVYLVI